MMFRRTDATANVSGVPFSPRAGFGDANGAAGGWAWTDEDGTTNKPIAAENNRLLEDVRMPRPSLSIMFWYGESGTTVPVIQKGFALEDGSVFQGDEFYRGDFAAEEAGGEALELGGCVCGQEVQFGFRAAGGCCGG